jgi:hypothetical protein
MGAEKFDRSQTDQIVSTGGGRGREHRFHHAEHHFHYNVWSSMLETTTPGIGELVLQQGELAGRRYRFQTVVCKNPTCDCKHLTLQCFTEGPEAGPTAPLSLEMDLERRQIANLEELKANPITRALATAAAADCRQEEWDQLRSLYLGVKQYWTEHSDLEQVEVSFPPDAATGAMVGYFDVFPFARRIAFIHEQEDWIVDDEYCCNPKCLCQEAVLSFIRLGEKMQEGPLEPTLSVSYRYRGGKAIRLEPAGDLRYSEQTLLESLKKDRADLDSLLARRQSLLRRLCARNLKEHTVHSPNSKIGRNDPCPCGSGKKWKKCCGA